MAVIDDAVRLWADDLGELGFQLVQGESSEWHKRVLNRGKSGRACVRRTSWDAVRLDGDLKLVSVGSGQ